MEVHPDNWLLAPTTVRTGEIAIRSREGYSGAVAVAAINLPAGITVTIEPNPIAVGQTGKLTVSAAPDSLPATYPLLIQASDGHFTRTVTLTATVVKQVLDLYLPVVSP